MSNFPIIPTTPPPLDINESEEEEEEETDFRAFNDLYPEEEKDIDFVVSDFTPDNETEGQTLSAFTDKTNIEDKQILKDIDNKSTDEKDINSCDNEFDTKTSSENETKFVATNEELNASVDQNDNHLGSNQNRFNHITEKPSEVVVEDKVVEEDFCDFNGVKSDDNDFEFSDFTSYESNPETKDLKSNDEFFDENQSISFYNSDISFGDFKDNSFQRDSEAINVSQNIDNDFNESDDDFADFASAQPVLNTDFESVSSFSSNITNQKFDEKDDGFADFASFQNSVDNGLVDNSTVYSENSTAHESEQLKRLFAEAFPSAQPFNLVENSPNISRDLFNSAEQNSKSLWKHLQDLETAPSLKLKWSTSHSFQLLLAALNIDPRNILRNSSVPMFASGLGYVLEPTKHNFDDLSEEIESDNTNGLTTSSIPPVQFDWSSSGLTNPLDANQKSVVAFDLDFFVTNDDVKNTSKQTGISNFEELLSDKIDSISDSDSHVLDKNKNNLMQQILSSVGTTSLSQTNANQVLSAEALQVLDELPNLSFLRAKVLMFPIIQSHK